MRPFLALALLGGLAGPAAACLNDRESPGHEREFRSDYGDPAAPGPSPMTRSTNPGLIVAGATLATLGVALTVGRRRAGA